MKQELTIVSGGDSNYFELLKDLLNSLLNLATRQEFNICFLDVDSYKILKFINLLHTKLIFLFP